MELGWAVVFHSGFWSQDCSAACLACTLPWLGDPDLTWSPRSAVWLEHSGTVAQGHCLPSWRLPRLSVCGCLVSAQGDEGVVLGRGQPVPVLPSTGSAGGLVCNQVLGLFLCGDFQGRCTPGAFSHSHTFNPVKISWAGKEHVDEKPISCILKFLEND